MDDVYAQYTLARRDFPDVDTHRLVEIIKDRMGPAEEARVIQESLHAMGSEAFQEIESFVWEIEGGYDDDDD